MIEQIKLINKVVYEAIVHGGDAGGPYLGNRESLEESLNNLIEEWGLSHLYKASCESKDYDDEIFIRNKQV